MRWGVLAACVSISLLQPLQLQAAPPEIVDHQTNQEAAEGKPSAPPLPTESPTPSTNAVGGQAAPDKGARHGYKTMHGLAAAACGWLWPIRPQGLTNFLMLVATGIMAFFTKQMVELNRKMAAAAEQSAIAAGKSIELAVMALHANRPLLLITRAGLGTSENHESGSKWMPHVHIKNRGGDRALIVGYIVKSEVFPFTKTEPTPDYDMGQMVSAPPMSILEPQAEDLGGLVRGDHLWVTAEEKTRLGQGRARIGCHGIIKYKSTVGGEYTSRFFWWNYFGTNTESHRAKSLELNSGT